MTARRSTLLMASLLALAACAAPAAPDSPTTPETPSAPTLSAEPSPPPPPDSLSGTVLGMFDTSAEQCAATTTMGRMTVAPDTIDFYYGHATVDSVAAQPGGGYEVDATLYQQEGAVEVVPEPATYRITPEGDGLRYEWVGVTGPTSLVRCES